MNVYVSATSRCSLHERKVVEDLLSGLGLRSWQFESSAASSPQSSLYQLCRIEMDRAELFIGIYGDNYGWIPPEDYYGKNTTDGVISFLEMEYHWALQRGIPMMIFFHAGVTDSLKAKPAEDQDNTKLLALRQRILQTHFVYMFHSLDNLRKLAGAAIVKTIHQRLYGAKPMDELIFISHSTRDDEFVTRLHHKLGECGLQTWVDHFHILPGADWDTMLEAALHAANNLIIVISENANRSLVVKAEWSYFGESGKKLYPILLDTDHVPFRLRVLQYTDFRTDPGRGFKRLLDALGTVDCPVSW